MATKILLADDSVTIQKVVELTFSDGDYEVTATTNGAQAIEMALKLRPDIILSDIIMPEKNGYEVCEYVKSHPELRSIPVILLTGTFEPFDPERADKAGCDAVVTKPFESQSLIQKVEELTSSSRANQEKSSTADSPSETVPLGTMSPFEDEAAQEEATTESESDTNDPFAASPEANEPALEPQTEPPAPSGDVFDESAELSGGEDDSATRMIPKMSFEDLDRIKRESSTETDQSREESSPAFQPGASDESPQAPFEDQEAQTPEDIPAPPFAQETGSAPFRIPDSPEPGVPPAEPTGPLAEEPSADASTRMIPKMSFEDLPSEQQPGDTESAPDSFEPSEPQPEEPAFPSAPINAPDPEEQDPFGSAVDIDDSSTRMIPKMSFADLQRLQQQEEAADDEAFPAESDAGPAEEERLAYEPPSGLGDSEPESYESAHEDEPVIEEASPGGDDEGTPFGREDDSSEQGWAPAGPTETPDAASASSSSDDEIERIARRVVEMLSDRVVREVAWEVIPEVAEMVVRERVRELESQDS